MKKISTVGLALRRAQYLVAAVLVLAVAPELIDGRFDLSVIWVKSQPIAGYWLIATFRDWLDPNMPNK